MSTTDLSADVGKPWRLAVAGALAISCGLFLLIAVLTFNQNDFMYAAVPTVWMQNGRLYSDVPFIQAPLAPMLNLLLVRVTGDANIFLPARLISIALLLIAVLLPLTVKRMRSGPLGGTVAALYVALCLTNIYIASHAEEIGNYALALLGLSAAVTALQLECPAWCRGLLAGVAIGLAVSAKLYFAVIGPGLFVYWLIVSEDARRMPPIAAFVLGGLIGCAPILYFLVVDFRSFWNWNVAVHLVIAEVRQVDAMTSLKRILKGTFDILPWLSIPAGFLLAHIVEAYRRGGPDLRREAAKPVLVGFAYLMAISPGVTFTQYFGPLVFLAFLLAMPPPAASATLRSMFVVFASVLLCLQWAQMALTIGYNAMRVGGLSVLQTIEVQRAARRIVMSGDYRCERKLFSGEPLFLLENGVKYPPEMATGPFLMFLRGHALPRSNQDFDPDKVIRRWNPDVVIWGYFTDSLGPSEDALERTVAAYAKERGFTVVPLGRVDGHDIHLAYQSDCKPPAS